MTRTRTPKTKNPNREPTFTGGGLRLLLFIVVALQWTCGVVDLGLTAYFEGTWVWLEGFHAMFGIVLGCVSSYFYFVYMWCAFIRIYKGYFLLANLFFSHLWLTYFIFNAIDYNGKGGCAAGQPAGIGHCSTKYALEAFSFATLYVSHHQFLLSYNNNYLASSQF